MNLWSRLKDRFSRRYVTQQVAKIPSLFGFPVNASTIDLIKNIVADLFEDGSLRPETANRIRGSKGGDMDGLV